MAITGIVAAKVLERYGPKDAAELAPAAARAATSCAGPGAEALADARSELARFLAAADTIERPSCLSGAIQKLSSYTSFAPMIVIGAVPDVRIGALVAACVAVANLLGSGLLKAAGLYKVWPKVFDIVNVSIYCTMAAVAFTHPQWTRLWLPLFTAGLTGSYFLASLLIRRPFCEELAKESAPREFWGNLAFKRLNFWISVWWTGALWVVTFCALASCLITQLRGPDNLAYLILNTVMGIAPLLVAIAAQHTLVAAFRRKLRAEVAAIKTEAAALRARRPPPARHPPSTQLLCPALSFSLRAFPLRAPRPCARNALPLCLPCVPACPPMPRAQGCPLLAT